MRAGQAAQEEGCDQAASRLIRSLCVALQRHYLRARYRWKKWYATIRVSQRNESLGHFFTEDAAARAYDACATRLHRPLNFLVRELKSGGGVVDDQTVAGGGGANSNPIRTLEIAPVKWWRPKRTTKIGARSPA